MPLLIELNDPRISRLTARQLVLSPVGHHAVQPDIIGDLFFGQATVTNAGCKSNSKRELIHDGICIARKIHMHGNGDQFDTR